MVKFCRHDQSQPRGKLPASRRCSTWPSRNTAQTCASFLLQHQKSLSNWSVARNWLVAYPRLSSTILPPCADRTQHNLAFRSIARLMVHSSCHPACMNTYSWSETVFLARMRLHAGSAQFGKGSQRTRIYICVLGMLANAMRLMQVPMSNVCSNLAFDFLCWCFSTTSSHSSTSKYICCDKCTEGRFRLDILSNRSIKCLVISL